MFKNIKIKVGTKITAVFFLAAVFSVFIVSYVYYQKIKSVLTGRIYDESNLILQYEAGQLNDFLEQKKDRIIDFASDGFIRNKAQEIISNHDGTGRDKLNDHLLKNKLILDPDIIGIVVISPEGRVISSSDPEEIGFDESDHPYFLSARNSAYGTAAVDDLTRPHHFKSKFPVIAFASPLFDIAKKERVGVIVNYIKMDALNRIISIGPMIKSRLTFVIVETKEEKNFDMHIVNKNGLIIASSAASGVLNQKIDNELIRGCGQKKPSNAVYENYREVSVIGASACFDNGWTLLAEFEEAKVLQPIKDMERTIFLIAILTIAGLLAFVYFVIRDIVNELSWTLEILGKSQEISHVGSWELDLANDELKWSDEVFRIFGLKPRQFGVTYEAFLKSVHPDDRKAVDEAYSDSIRDNKDGYEIEHRIVRPDGEIRIVHEKCEHFKNKKGKIIRSVGMVQDITEHKKIDRAKTEFVSLASHQLRTPLSIISWYAEMLLSEKLGRFRKKQKEYVNEIYISNKRLVSLVNALLDVSRIELGTFKISPESIDVLKIADGVLTELLPTIKKKKLKITKQYEKNLPSISADPDVMRIIFQNIIFNSVQYTPDEGQIKIEILRQKPNVFIKVSDTGIGIPEEAQSKVFEKLYRADNAKETEPAGTGLGLYIVKSVLDAVGGKIWLKSPGELGKGTTFYVTIQSAGTKEKEGQK